MVDGVNNAGAAAGAAAKPAAMSLDAVKSAISKLNARQLGQLLDSAGGAGDLKDPVVAALAGNPQLQEALKDQKIFAQVNSDHQTLKDLNKRLDKLLDKLAEVWKNV